MDTVRRACRPSTARAISSVPRYLTEDRTPETVRSGLSYRRAAAATGPLARCTFSATRKAHVTATTDYGLYHPQFNTLLDKKGQILTFMETRRLLRSLRRLSVGDLGRAGFDFSRQRRRHDREQPVRGAAARVGAVYDLQQPFADGQYRVRHELGILRRGHATPIRRAWCSRSHDKFGLKFGLKTAAAHGLVRVVCRLSHAP